MRRIEAPLRLLVVAGLAVDAYVHLHLAGSYTLVRTATVSGATLFRLEAVAAVVAGLLTLAHPRRWTLTLALVVAAGGAAAVVLYRYADPGTLGPIPDMYEPVWFAEKTWSLVGEVVAAGAAGMWLGSRRTHAAPTDPAPAQPPGRLPRGPGRCTS